MELGPLWRSSSKKGNPMATTIFLTEDEERQLREIGLFGESAVILVTPNGFRAIRENLDTDAQIATLSDAELQDIIYQSEFAQDYECGGEPETWLDIVSNGNHFFARKIEPEDLWEDLPKK